MNYFIKIKNNKSGFTLIETIVTIFIFGILMLGTTLMLKDILTNSRQQSKGISNTDQARRIAANFVNEIRNCEYGVNGAYPINQADDTQIVFFSTAPDGNGTVSRVRYYMSNGILYKGITDPTGSPLSYNTNNEIITPIFSSLSLGTNPLFYYYDGNYDGSTNPLAQPVNINQIKFVKINLIVLKQDTLNSTNTTTINAGAAMRNLKTNLGN
ncbi:MAG: prepilin-type N-terminal cleavage/methylation domain-containing protein [Patescibacteria group bacterium]|nr:prepilin-type N-terminal cleavage/methylation domain-containing protein [Patescibacteria group bacterium]